MLNEHPPLATFSIVAFDPETKDLGIATQSKFIAVGSVVPWVKAQVGAIATQAAANVSYGPRGLDMLERGLHPKEVVRSLVEEDQEAGQRQLAVVDSQGRVAAFTGKECYEWAGHVIGKSHCSLGNILASEDVVRSMATAYEETEEDLPERLLAALEAGQKAGGDRRGQQSAALLVARSEGGYGGYTDRYIDIRVDEHPRPIEELKRIFKVYDLTLLERESPEDVVELAGEVGGRVKEMLARTGFYRGSLDESWGADALEALRDYFNINNFENKWREDGFLWKSVYNYMRETIARD